MSQSGSGLCSTRDRPNKIEWRQFKLVTDWRGSQIRADGFMPESG